MEFSNVKDIVRCKCYNGILNKKISDKSDLYESVRVQCINISFIV